MSEFNIIGLLGQAGSGKDLVADYFVSKGYVKVAFAGPMKRFLKQAFGLTNEQLWGESDKRNEEFDVNEEWWLSAVEKFNSAAEEIIHLVLEDGFRVQGFVALYDWFTKLRSEYGRRISPRVILQTLGTDWGRVVDPLMWVKYAHKIAQDLEYGGWAYSQQEGLYPEDYDAPKGIVIPDTRFLNEIDYLRSLGNGYVLRIKRLAKKPKEILGVPNHPSEEEQKEIPDGKVNLILECGEGKEKVHSLVEYVYTRELWNISAGTIVSHPETASL